MKKVTNVGVYEHGLFMIDNSEKECDFCDEIKECASINWIGGNVIIVCKDCLQQFVNAFNKKQLPPKPITPMSRIIREGTIGSCPKCHSTEQKRFGIFGGKKIGCINPECENYYKK